MDHTHHTTPIASSQPTETPTAIDLRPYQIEARDRILVELSAVRSTLLVLATGLGKTICFAAVAHAYVARGSHVLVIAHRGELLDQAAATLRRFGLTVAVEQGDRRVDRESLPDVVVASVQTMQRARLQSWPGDTFGLVIVDEAHHIVAASYRAVLDHFAVAKVLAVTATPDRTDDIGLGNVIETVSLRIEIGAGIRGGWLAPIELRSVIVDDLDLSRVRVVAGEMHAAELEAELLNEQVLHQVSAPLAELASGRQTLIFTVGVAQAHALAKVLDGYGVRAAAVDGSMSADARAAVLADYRSGRLQAVANAMLWTEGFDAPETSCIALVRPTSSRSLVTQMIGRGTRVAPGKANCLVLDFIPHRASKIRLAGPADALAGEALPDDLTERIRSMSGAEPADLESLIVRAKAQKSEAEAVERATKQTDHSRTIAFVRQVGVAYAAPRMDIATLLSAIELGDHDDTYGSRADDGERSGNGGNHPRPLRLTGSRPATERQRAALEKSGFVLPQELSMREASALFDVLTSRREKGLCTLRQARQLHKYGLRDDVSMRDASAALDSIARNGWKLPRGLRDDARFAPPVDEVSP